MMGIIDVVRPKDYGESMANEKCNMNRCEAMLKFKQLVGKYGLQWTASVPREAYELLAECNKVLDQKDRREALGLRG